MKAVVMEIPENCDRKTDTLLQVEDKPEKQHSVVVTELQQNCDVKSKTFQVENEEELGSSVMEVQGSGEEKTEPEIQREPLRDVVIELKGNTDVTSEALEGKTTREKFCLRNARELLLQE